MDGFTVVPAAPPDSTRVPVVEYGKDAVFPSTKKDGVRNTPAGASGSKPGPLPMLHTKETPVLLCELSTEKFTETR
jgi:hypothetical protein